MSYLYIGQIITKLFWNRTKHFGVGSKSKIQDIVKGHFFSEQKCCGLDQNGFVLVQIYFRPIEGRGIIFFFFGWK